MPSYKIEEFDVTKDHIKLLEKMHVTWTWDCCEGAPQIDSKRPYGNSCVGFDVAEILGWPIPECETGEWSDMLDKGIHIHREMEIVLQILLSCGVRNGLTPGKYKKKIKFSATSWEKE